MLARFLCPHVRTLRRAALSGLPFAVFAVFSAACATVGGPEADWPPLAKQWYERAQESYRHLDVEDAEEAIHNALRIEPQRGEVRELAAQIALSQLDYAGTLKHTETLTSTKARGLRARALWYSGKVNEAADELDTLLADPGVRDTWAEGAIKLARQANGRTPFAIKGDMLAVMEMPRLQSTAMVVPVELNGQPVLALLATGTPEVVLDSAGDRNPSWVTLRFAERIEVKDVPALTQDLSGLSRDLNAPIRLLLGTHLLRHLNATVDFLGRQFIVRSFEPPPPPAATKVALSYIRGGGMAFSSRIGLDDKAPAFSFLVDTGSAFTVVLDEPVWGQINVEPSSQTAVPGTRGLRQTSLPHVQLGAYSIPNVPAIGGVPFKDLEERLDTDLDGLVGSGLLGAFRVTWANGGRSLWLEDAATFVGGVPDGSAPAAPPGTEPQGGAPEAAAPGNAPPASLAPTPSNGAGG
jgi:hypothetical protein